MGSERNSIQPSRAKRNWTEREWQLYRELPWVVQKFVDLLIRIPRFVKAKAARQSEIAVLDRREQFVSRRLMEARRRRRAF
jgi:hypothetical protein